MGACAGLRVLEVAAGFDPACLCGQLFAGLGAEVVKLEAATGDPLRGAGPALADGSAYLFHLVNAAKGSVVLHGDTATSAQQWRALLGWADVVIAGELRPEQSTGTSGDGGADIDADLHPELFAAAWPNKVLCTISTFGHDGARAAWTGNELIAEAMGGLMACTGYPERPPVKSGVSYGAHVAALFGFHGVLAAIHARQRTGRGQTLDISVVDCLVALLGNFIPSFFLTGREPKRIGNRHTIAAPWNIYPTSNGYVVICTGTGGSGWWESICSVIGRDELAHDSRYDQEAKRVERVDEIDDIVSQWTRRFSAAEVAAAMTKQGIPVSEISAVESVLSNPQYRDTRAMVIQGTIETDTGSQPVPLVGLPLKLGAWTAPGKAGPELGTWRLPDPRQAASTSASSSFSSAASSAGALQGIRVLEFGSRTSVPMAGRMLTDLGADVVKIEPRKGESLRGAGQQVGGSSYLFHINNGGKRSVVIEPTLATGRELILQLASKADVWIENLAPGALDRMGLGFADLRAVNPRLVYCSLSGFGHRSDYADAKAFDAVVQAASGCMFVTGYPDHLPVKIGLSASDLAAGVALVGAVLGGLRERDHTNAGLHIDLAMADVGVWMTQSVWPEVYYGSGHPARMGNRSATVCPHNIFATSDGYVAISADTDAMWMRLAGLVGGPELKGNTSLATVDARLRSVEKVEALIAAWTANRSADVASRACQAAGVAAAPVRKLEDIVKDPDVAAHRLIVEVDHPLGGRMKLLGNPLRFSATRAGVDSAAPMLGEHTDEVLRSWLELSLDRIVALANSGVVLVAGTNTKRSHEASASRAANRANEPNEAKV